jgi:hypothetical protein
MTYSLLCEACRTTCVKSKENNEHLKPEFRLIVDMSLHVTQCGSCEAVC